VSYFWQIEPMVGFSLGSIEYCPEENAWIFELFFFRVMRLPEEE